jgi:hypothetical protein
MNTQTFDDIEIVINQTDTEPEGSANFITLNRLGTEKFSLDNKGNILNSNTGSLVTKTIKKTIGGGGMKSQGTITVSGTPVAEQKMIIGETTFTFKAARAVAGEVTINANNSTQVTNIVTAITADSTDVVGLDGAGDTVVVTAADVGVAGDLLPFSETATGIAMDGSGFLGGTTPGIDATDDCDYNFSCDEDTTEQIIELEDIIPARARVVDVFLVTDEEFTGVTSLVADVGSTTGDDDYIASATIYAADAVLAPAVGGSFLIDPDPAVSSIFINATPGADWSLMESGKVSVYVTYIDVGVL